MTKIRRGKQTDAVFARTTSASIAVTISYWGADNAFHTDVDEQCVTVDKAREIFNADRSAWMGQRDDGSYFIVLPFNTRVDLCVTR